MRDGLVLSIFCALLGQCLAELKAFNHLCGTDNRYPQALTVAI